MKVRTNEQTAMHVSRVSILGNVLLTAFKLFAGIFARSGAMLSDAVHSASDVFSTVVVMIGVKLANRASDKDHPYGHERLECVAAILLAALLFATGIGIGANGVEHIVNGTHGGLAVPGALALVAAVVSIVLKEAMYWYTRAAAKKIHSSALMADAWHHRSDALSSIGSFVGIFGARLGFPILDPIASVVICLFILKAAVDIFRDAINKMTDRACDDEVVEEIRGVAAEQEGVLAIDQIKTRLFGDKVYVDLEIQADGSETLTQAHGTAQCVHDAIEARFPAVKHCMVHVNPSENEPQA
ncbi:cation diffusion facilitator family transporter [Clostridium sp. D33t1_170424_F3]|uniref:cation diffusion facilitator family transporter n=1 Tax=Clostridium sp. D33t1_170424_F3 TaxID=2787099 RepID=UPI0018AA4477|nr:cation diffusion facilitator family transporter [Clostridium sp. D33t1_170424_F3]